MKKEEKKMKKKTQLPVQANPFCSFVDSLGDFLRREARLCESSLKDQASTVEEE